MPRDILQHQPHGLASILRMRKASHVTRAVAAMTAVTSLLGLISLACRRTPVRPKRAFLCALYYQDHGCHCPGDMSVRMRKILALFLVFFFF